MEGTGKENVSNFEAIVAMQPILSRRAFLESPENSSDPKSWVLTNKDSFFFYFESLAVKSYFNNTILAAIQAKNFKAIRYKLHLKNSFRR